MISSAGRSARLTPILSGWIVLTLALLPGCQVDDSWSRLHSRSAWIFLGVLDAGSDEWRTAASHRVVEGDQAGALPKVGDVLELTIAAPLVIIDYRSSGENKLLVSPADRPGAADDVTGIVLPSLSRVRVLDVRIHSTPTGPRECWVRVGPP